MDCKRTRQITRRAVKKEKKKIAAKKALTAHGIESTPDPRKAEQLNFSLENNRFYVLSLENVEESTTPTVQ